MDFRHHRVITLTVLVLMSIGTGLIALMLGASNFGMPMFYSYFSSPLIVLLNVLPPVLLTLLVYFAVGRAWISFTVPALIIFILAVISFFKMQVRSEPLVFSDFRLADEAGKVMAGYDLIINWKIWAAAAYTALGAVAALFLLRYKPRVKTRIIGAVSALLAGALLYTFLYTNERIYNSAKGSYEVDSWSNAETYIARGFVFPYIYSIQDSKSKPPSGYDQDSGAAALAAFGNDVIPDGKKVNIVSVMLESYSDLSVYSGIHFNQDVYGPLHALEQESVSGQLVDNIFAGGTIDTERSFLTGYTMLDDFMTPVNSYIYYFREQGYYTEGFHAGDGWYYDRKTVNAALGFNDYYFLESFPDSSRWDDYFFPKVINLFESRNTSVPYFSYNLSYQNHGPYDSTKTSDTAYISRDGLTDASYSILNNYLEGISDTTRRIAAFVDYFRAQNAPVVVVLFGDHKPWLGNDNEVYNELGINIDLSTEQGFYNFYTTPYIIWANDAAKAVLETDFTGDGGDFSPCFLMNKLFDLCSWGGNAYMKAADELRKHTDVVNTATGYFSVDGTLTTSLSGDAKAVYKNFKDIEYYWLHNFMN